MTQEDHVVAITLFSRTYQIKCPSDEVAQLQEAANYLSAEMQKINQSSHTSNMERLAIVTALNVTNELMLLKGQKNNYIDVMHDQLKSLQTRIQSFLHAKEEALA